MAKMVASHFDEKQMQALHKLSSAGKKNKSEVIRDLLEWAYHPLLRHYCDVPMVKPEPLPEVKGEG